MCITKIVIGTITMVLVVCEMHGQATTSTAGGDAKSSRGSTSYTVGQPMYNTTSATRGSVSEGVQQPVTFQAIAGETVTEINLISAFPNPTTTSLTLKVALADRKGYTCELHDLRGRLLHSQDVESELTPLPIESLASGAFVLRVLKNNELIKSFQIIKKQ